MNRRNMKAASKLIVVILTSSASFQGFVIINFGVMWVDFQLRAYIYKASVMKLLKFERSGMG